MEHMSTLKKSLSIGVYGHVWAQSTVNFLKTVNICGGKVHRMEYSHREALFIDQDEIFVITDFGKKPDESWDANDGYWLKRLNEMREIIYSRSMKSLIFANDDDKEVSKALREACCGVVRINTHTSIPQTFALAIIADLYTSHNPNFKKNSIIVTPDFTKNVA